VEQRPERAVREPVVVALDELRFEVDGVEVAVEPLDARRDALRVLVPADP
jgi:hypothetical protein